MGQHIKLFHVPELVKQSYIEIERSQIKKKDGMGEEFRYKIFMTITSKFTRNFSKSSKSAVHLKLCTHEPFIYSHIS